MARIAAGIILMFIVAAIFAAPIAPYRPKEELDTPLQSPSLRHIFGTDDVGRDILSQVIVGTRVSLMVGASAAIAATALGLIFGLCAGYFGGRVDTVIMRIVDIFLALPRFPLLILLAAYLGAGVWVIVIVFAITSWAMPTRVIRAQVLSDREKSYIMAAKLFGAGPFYIIRKHLLPQLSPLISAIIILEAAHAIMAEAGLSFLGLGDPAYISWGTILHYSFVYPSLFLTNTWLWWAVPPGMCLSILLLALTIISRAMEESLDPRLKEGRVVS
jgi:peptide/nickel transport system permease protein